MNQTHCDNAANHTVGVSAVWRFSATLSLTSAMNSDDMFNWPDGDVILRSAHGTETRDFRVHKLFLSFTSPVFKDMFTIPQPSSSVSDIDIVDLTDPPRALELVLRFIYPSPVSPIVKDLTIALEALNIADKYDIEVARSRLRSSFMEFAKTEPLRVYAVACRLGLEEEMKIASTHTLPIDLSALTQLPDEFKHIPATEYHRLIHLHTRYRNAVKAIPTNSSPRLFTLNRPSSSRFRDVVAEERVARATLEMPVVDTLLKGIVDVILKGTPLDYGNFTLGLKTVYGVDIEVDGSESNIRSVIDKTNALNLTV